MTLEVDVTVRRDGFAVQAAFGARPGETLALLGPNGAGKSTVVSSLAGLLLPERGSIRLSERTLDDAASGWHSPPEQRPVGVVFQALLLFPHLSAADNVAFPLRARGGTRRGSRRTALQLLERFGVSHRADAKPAALSGGEAQRVALARALVAQPDLLLLDEPMSALDVRARTQIRPLLREVLAGFPGVRVLVTHDPVEAMTLADRMVILEEGRVTQMGTTEQIRQRPRTPYAAELVGLNLFRGRLEPLEQGAGLLRTEEGTIVVAWPEEAAGATDGVLGLLRPADVAIHMARPEAGSARNVLSGEIAAVAVETDRARVHVASAPPVVAEVTLGSVSRLGLRAGTPIWASFKAVEVRVELP